MSKIIGVVSITGGAGTTFFAANLAAWAAQHINKTVLTETSQDNILGALFMREKSLNSLSTPSNKDDLNIEETALKTSYGLSVLPGMPGLQNFEPGKLYEMLSSIYKLIIIDLGNDPNRQDTKAIINICDSIYLIAIPTLECVETLSRYFKTIEHQRNKFKLVINKASPQAYYRTRDVARYLDFDKFTTIPFEPKHINKAIQKRSPMVFYGKGRACKVIRRFAEDINLSDTKITSNKKSHEANNFAYQPEEQKQNECSLSTIDLSDKRINTDHLTGCFTRAVLESSLNEQDGIYSVLFCDLDNFKLINDAYGHAVGDEILRTFGDFLLRSTRRSDYVIRYGGDEFVVVLSGTETSGAIALAEKMCNEWNRKKFACIDNKNVLFSGGVAQIGKHGDTPEALLKAADDTLYRVKHSGKGRVESASNSRLLSPSIKAIPDEPLVVVLGDGTQALHTMFSGKLKKSYTFIDADPGNTKLSYLLGMEPDQVWKHDWRLGLTANPYVCNKKLHLFGINKETEGIDDRDLRALTDLVRKDMKSRNVIVHAGDNNEIFYVLEIFNPRVIGGI